MNLLFYIFGYLFKWDSVCEFLVTGRRALEYLIGDNKIPCRKDTRPHGARRESPLLSSSLPRLVDTLTTS